MEEEEDQYGRHFGKLDIDRIGFFDNTPPGPFDLYETKITKDEVREGLDKGKRLLCTQKGGLFENELKRIFIGEILPELGCPRKKDKKKPLSGTFRPVGTPKLHSTPGDWYGCIGKQPKAFSPELKPPLEPPEKPEKKLPNCMTNPNPRGGPGYLRITINPYLPMYNDYEPYDLEKPKPIKRPDNEKPRRFIHYCFPEPYFDNNPYTSLEEEEIELTSECLEMQRHMKPKKKYFYLSFPRAPKGKTSGCFHKFPSHLPDPYDKKRPKPKKKKELPKLSAGAPPMKSKFTTSIIDRVTNIALNANNFSHYQEQVYPLN